MAVRRNTKAIKVPLKDVGKIGFSEKVFILFHFSFFSVFLSCLSKKKKKKRKVSRKKDWKKKWKYEKQNRKIFCVIKIT